jgi:hypothetical protein
MKRKIRLSVTDGAGTWQTTRAAILSAVPPGKTLVQGTTWNGDLRPKVDAMLDQLQSLTTPFTTGRTLHAQVLSPNDALLGRTWTGDLQARLSRAATPTGDTDMSGVFQELEALHLALGTTNPEEVADRIGRVRRAADAIRTKTRTTDSNWGTAFLNRSRGSATSAIAQIKRAGTAEGAARVTADCSADMRGKIAAMNEANRAFWANR